MSYRKIFMWLFALVVAGSVGAVLVVKAANLQNKTAKLEQEILKLKATPAPVATTTPTKYSARTTIKPTADPDPFVNCLKSSECGGGSVQLKKSQCDQTVCCSRLGKWIFYMDKGQCLNDQRADSQYNQAQQDKTNQGVTDCVNRAAQSKESCYDTCSFWYNSGDSVRGNECGNGCYDLYEKATNNCYGV